MEYGYKELGEYLLAKGANPELINVKGFKGFEGIKPKRNPFDYL